jgi:hypothetical protein
MKAMESSQNFPMEGKVDMGETYVGSQDDQAIRPNESKKRSWLLQWSAKEFGRPAPGVSRMYGRFIETADKKNLKKFMSESIHKDTPTAGQGIEV